MAFDSNIKGYMTFGKSFSRGGAFPLEAYEIWTDYDALVAYAANTNPDKDPSYIGQKVAFVDKVNNKVTHYGIEIDGSLKELGATPIGDEKSIVVDETNYTISLKGVDGLVFERDILGEDGEPTGEKEEVKFQPLMTKDGLVWVEPSKTTVEGLATLISELTVRVKALEDDRVTEQELADAIAGVEAKIEAVDFVDEDELAEAIKDFATDEEVATAVATEKERAEAAEKALGERIDAIDFVDTDELATALEPYAKTADVNEAIAAVNAEVTTKAKQTDLKALEDTVNAFLTGDGAEGALDSLKELIAYIESHDDVDIAGIMEDIQAIENKLVLGTYVDGEETKEYATVKDYVEAAIAALSIGDYAKAADLTALADRVAVLEAKPFDSYATKEELEAHANTAAETYATKDELAAHEEAAANAYATKDELTAHEEAAAETYATKEELAAHEEAAEAAYATKAELEAHAEAAEAAYATKDELKATDDIAKDSQNRVGIVEGKIDEITSVGGEPNIIEKIKVNGVTLEVEKDGEGKSTKTVSIAVPTSITTLDGYADLNTRVTTNANGIAALEGQLANTNTNVSGNTIEIGKINTDITTNIKPAIEALEGADAVIEETIAGHTAAIKTLNETTIPALQGTINSKAAQTDVDAINTKIGTVEDGKTIVDMINAVAGTIDFTPYAKKDEVAATYATIEALNAEIARADAAEKANAKAIADLTAGAVKDNTDAIAALDATLKAAIENDGEGLDSIKELALWIEEHETDVVPQINQNKEDVAALALRVTANETAVGTTLPAAIAAAEAAAKKYTDDTMVKADGTSIVNNEGTFSVGAVSTDNLVQGTMTLVLNGGNANVQANA